MRHLALTLALSTALCASATFAQEAAPPDAATLSAAQKKAAAEAELFSDVRTQKSPGYLTAAQKKPENSYFAAPAQDALKMTKKLLTEDEEKKAAGLVANPKDPAHVDPKDIAVQGSAIGAIPGEQVKKPEVEKPSITYVPPGPPARLANGGKPAAAPAPDPSVPKIQMTPAMRSMKPGDENAPITAELSDGTSALFRSDGSVAIVRSNGFYVIPPDGVLTLKDGTTFAVEHGKRVSE